jgi:hypothetical protein
LVTDPKNDLWAFREGRKSIRGTALLAEVVNSSIAFCASPDDRSLAISALMRAGEFETSIADAGSPTQATAEQLTDTLARAFVGDTSENEQIRPLLQEIGRFEMPEFLSVSPPEGFAYYALHPHDFARLAKQVDTTSNSAMVIGIRSIGTTLGAIVRAALEKQGRITERITVRPTGHPYDRVVRFSPAQLQSIAERNARRADFLVVDEGPGRSGSSLLSVAEALVKAGVPRNRIRLLGSRPVDVNQLCAEHARERWSQFTFLWPTPSVNTRFSNHLYIGGGNWRDVFCAGQANWPACWPQMERLKFLSPDGHSIYKFEGFGRFGEDVLSRAKVLADANFGCKAFGCKAEDAGDGMIRYPVIEGGAANASDVSTALLRRLAQYCAYRTAEFRSRDSAPTQLPAMLAFNTLQEFGVELGAEINELCAPESILTDGRMQPHEWICVTDGSLLKVDAYTHGDDHFFPGPTDIAWDLAGTIVEWNLDKDATDLFLSEFHRISGMNRAQIVPLFVLAYTVFRLAYGKMALSTVKGSSEEPRITAAYLRYRRLAEQQLRDLGALNNQVIKALEPNPLPDSSVQSGTAA